MPSHFNCVQLFATPWTVACQVPLVLGILQTKYWRGLPCLPPGDLPNLGIEPVSPAAPALQMDSLPLSHQRRHNIFTTFLWIWKYSEIESVLKIILWGHVHSAAMEMSLETLATGECLGHVRLYLHHLLKSLEHLYETFIILPTSQLWMRKLCAQISFMNPVCMNLKSRENNLLFVD